MPTLTILRTDSVMDDFQPEFGDYPQMFRDLIERVVPGMQVDEIDARVALPSGVNSDFYLITGSRHSVYDDLPWISNLVDFLRTALDAGAKIIGICFGHQLMAHFFGGEVGPADAGWGVGVHTSMVNTETPWLNGSEKAEPVRLLVSHKDQVKELPEQAQVYLGSDFCPVGGFTLGSQIVTVQGHPEFEPGYSRALMNFRREILGETTWQQGMDSLSQALDSERVLAWMFRFLELDGVTSAAEAAVEQR